MIIITNKNKVTINSNSNNINNLISTFLVVLGDIF